MLNGGSDQVTLTRGAAEKRRPSLFLSQAQITERRGSDAVVPPQR